MWTITGYTDHILFDSDDPEESVFISKLSVSNIRIEQPNLVVVQYNDDREAGLHRGQWFLRQCLFTEKLSDYAVPVKKTGNPDMSELPVPRRCLTSFLAHDRKVSTV